MIRLLLGLTILAPIFAQEHIPVPLADANRPVIMSIHLLHGSVTVRAYNGHEVIVDTKEGTAASEGEKEKTHEGLHRIGGAGSDITIESDNNKVSISSHGGRSGDVTVQTPANTSLNVKTLAGGQITIEGLSGEIEAQDLNGPVTIRNVSGSVVASSLNGGVTVTMTSVKSGSPMSFTSLNGNIDVTLPANVAADFSMKTNRGEIYSDFDVKLKAPSKPVAEQTDAQSNGKKGKFKVHTDGAVVGSVNGGGAEYRFSTLNGNVYIRKK
jgi:DUF4097 and DUF4098 domain-containing protein YvlB